MGEGIPLRGMKGSSLFPTGKQGTGVALFEIRGGSLNPVGVIPLPTLPEGTPPDFPTGNRPLGGVAYGRNGSRKRPGAEGTMPERLLGAFAKRMVKSHGGSSPSLPGKEKITANPRGGA